MSANPAVKDERKLVPTISINWNGNEILNLNVGLGGQWTAGNQSLGSEKVGDAYIQIVNQEWISEPLIDYIGSKFVNFPRELRYSEPLHITNYNDRIKQQYVFLDDALTCMDYGHSEIQGTIAVIHSIQIYPLFRKQGLFKIYLWLILKALKENLKVDYVLLQAWPIEIQRKDKKAYGREKSRLEKMYMKSGFKKGSKVIIANDGFKISYMFQKISNRSFDHYDFN
jgi:hypothetical protein